MSLTVQKLQILLVLEVIDIRQDTVQLTDDVAEFCGEKARFQKLLARSSLVRQLWDCYRNRCREVKRVVGDIVPREIQIKSGTGSLPSPSIENQGDTNLDVDLSKRSETPQKISLAIKWKHASHGAKWTRSS